MSDGGKSQNWAEKLAIFWSSFKKTNFKSRFRAKIWWVYAFPHCEINSLQNRKAL